jgi:hypothetical protein
MILDRSILSVLAIAFVGLIGNTTSFAQPRPKGSNPPKIWLPMALLSLDIRCDLTRRLRKSGKK